MAERDSMPDIGDTTQSLELRSSIAEAPELIGANLGDYTIELQVARGGYAQVYRGVSKLDGRPVAIKVLHPELSGSGMAVARFLREADVLARLDHPNIVKILAAGEITTRPYIVMEWLPGHTLADELGCRGRFSLDELLGVLEEICSALTTAHAAGVIHRDIKPSNIVVVPEGEWFLSKLVDFGIARLVGEGHGGEGGRLGLTATGTVIGTPTYMAPEQLLGQKVDEKSDIYALGIIGFELLVGRPPFTGDGQMDTSEQHLFVPAPRVSSLVPVPVAVDNVIARCLAKRPGDRYPSVSAFIEDLRSAVRGSSRSTEPGNTQLEHLGIHLEVAFDGPDDALDDGVLERIDALLMRAETLLTAAEMDVIPAAGAAILARQTLLSGLAGRSTREAALRLALEIGDEMLRDISSSDITFSIAVHLVTDPDELLDPRWTVKTPRATVVATKAVLDGLSDSFDTAELNDDPEVRRVFRSRR